MKWGKQKVKLEESSTEQLQKEEKIVSIGRKSMQEKKKDWEFRRE